MERLQHIKNTFYLMSHINIDFLDESLIFHKKDEIPKGLKSLNQIYEEYKGRNCGCWVITENLIEKYIIKITHEGMYIIGPYLNKTLSNDDYKEIKKKYNLMDSFEELKNYFDKHRKVPENDNVLYMNMINGLDKLSDEEFEETISQTEGSRHKIDHSGVNYTYNLWKTDVDLKSIQCTNEFFKELFSADKLEEAYVILEKYYFISKDFEDLYFQLNVNPKVLIKNLVISSLNVTFMYALQYEVDMNEALDILIKYNFLIEDAVSIDELKNLRGHFLVEFYMCVRKVYVDKEHPLVNRVKRYVRDNLNKKISLKELAQATGYNQSYLSNQFKVLTGINIINYVQGLKVKKAKELLKNTDDSVLDVASYLGFTSSTDFRRVFKKFTDKTPREYRY